MFLVGAGAAGWRARLALPLLRRRWLTRPFAWLDRNRPHLPIRAWRRNSFLSLGAWGYNPLLAIVAWLARSGMDLSLPEAWRNHLVTTLGGLWGTGADRLITETRWHRLSPLLAWPLPRRTELIVCRARRHRPVLPTIAGTHRRAPLVMIPSAPIARWRMIVLTEIVITARIDIKIPVAPARCCPPPQGTDDRGADPKIDSCHDYISRNRVARRKIIRGIGRVSPRPVNDLRIVNRHIDDALRDGGNDDQVAIVSHNLLIRAAQKSGELGLPTQPLNRIKRRGFLLRNRECDLRDPIQVRRHNRHNLREWRKRFHRGIPWQRPKGLVHSITTQ